MVANFNCMKISHFVKIIISLLLMAMMQGCNNNAIVDKMKDQLIQTDKDFSALSEKVGMKAAFLEYADENVVLLRPNHRPLEGKTEMNKNFKSFSDSSFILTWQPLFATVARSGDLGYTYGIYTSAVKDEDGNRVENKGTYVSVWKRDVSGKWKFVVDSGNEGLGED